MGRGGNFKEGYLCMECVSEGLKSERDEPQESLYTRDRSGFHHAGLVKCLEHGVQKAIRIRDL